MWVGSFPKSDELCARDDTPPERLIPFVNASDSALTVCSSMRRHCHHQQIVFCGGHCFPDWPLFFLAGHRSKLVTVPSWSPFQAGHRSKLVTVPSWSPFQVGHRSKLVTVPSWSPFQVGHRSKLVTVPSWSPFQVGHRSKLVTVPSWSPISKLITVLRADSTV
ncbi:hypothetical protein N7466_001415 [Penicillium verhagenii]|uniref:uncharacterized protein n=1 Tax=Penicillium verhagenii TaxID=1562060 RepID=UPI002544F368|nr:uncharacterized protein N7466_001415 [Penicillium verhagenii]KAJ5938281.1 hypothetical protein N7466_001415 [Penicillium verhagenii]